MVIYIIMPISLGSSEAFGADLRLGLGGSHSARHDKARSRSRLGASGICRIYLYVYIHMYVYMCV